MGFNPMEKMKAAAANKLDEAKSSVKNKAGELKDTALEKGKEGAAFVGKKGVEGAKAGIKALREGPKEQEPVHITTAEDFTGDLTNPVTILIDDDYDAEYYEEYAEYEPDEREICAECQTPFRDVEHEYRVNLDSFDKSHPCLKDKSFADMHFCSVECARKAAERKYPGAFITDSSDEFHARLMAGRKANGTESFADKLANKASASGQKMQERREAAQARQESMKPNGILEKLFPILKLFRK